MSILHDLHKAHVARRMRWFGPERRRRVAQPRPESQPPPVSPTVDLGRLICRAEEIAMGIEDSSVLPTIHIPDIVRTVAEFYGITAIDLLSQRREASIIRPRHVAMYLAKTITLLSLPAIGRRMGGRDHTTVMHAVHKIAARMAVDERLRDEIDLIIIRLAERHLLPLRVVAGKQEARS